MNILKEKPTLKSVIDVDGLRKVLLTLATEGYELVGPTIKDNAIVYDSIESLEDLPQNWKDQQEPGVYRIHKTDDQKYFNYTVGPHSWKKYLHPPNLRLWHAERRGSSFKLTDGETTPKTYAFIGVRPCEIQAIRIQDRVFRGDQFKDKHYDQTRSRTFILAVNCGRANETCFCNSMNSGPRATEAYDLALTEFFSNGRHLFLVDLGSENGRKTLNSVVTYDVKPKHLEICQQQYKDTCSQMARKINVENLRETLLANPNHPRWEEVAERCLSCANCTMACPTCFCTTVEDTTDLTGNHTERWRRWDSCFTMDFSYVAGGNIRKSTKSRYRQWITHKLATWHDQFDTTGCVGCGRCITWCPVGIDITEEVAAIQKSSTV